MPANLPAPYYEAERRFRAAKGTHEKVAALQEMMSATPKHKGTDHLRADMRARMARLMEELERPRNISSGQPSPFALRKEGVGQAILIGLPNTGKSQVLASLTGAATKVAAYPFTTQVPLPGMLQFQNVRIQLVDTPAINDSDMQTRLFSLLRNADLLLMALDLSTDVMLQIDETEAELNKWGYILIGKGDVPDPDEQRVQKRAILIANKADEARALDQYQRLVVAYEHRFEIVMVSMVENVGLDELKAAIFNALDKVRVYTKPPGGQPSYDSPIVLDQGSKAEDAALSLHKDWQRKMKYAVLWGSGKFDGQRVGRDYVISDGDVLEFH